MPAISRHRLDAKSAVLRSIDKSVQMRIALATESDGVHTDLGVNHFRT